MTAEKSDVGWYFISIIEQRANNTQLINSYVDAVFADGSVDAIQQAYRRNPLRVNQAFASRPVSGPRNKRKAIEINEQRNETNAKFQELMQC